MIDYIMVAMAWLVALVLREKHHHTKSHENLIPQSEHCTSGRSTCCVRLRAALLLCQFFPRVQRPKEFSLFAYQPPGGWTRDCEFLDLALVYSFLEEDL